MQEDTTKDRWLWVALGTSLLSGVAISIFMFAPNGLWRIPAIVMVVVFIAVLFLNPKNILFSCGTAMIAAGLAGLSSLNLKIAAILPNYGPFEASLQGTSTNPPNAIWSLIILGTCLIVLGAFGRGWIPIPLKSAATSAPAAIPTVNPRTVGENDIVVAHELASADFFVDDTTRSDRNDAIQTLSMRCKYTFTCFAGGHDEASKLYLQFQRNQNTALQWRREHADLMSETFASVGRSNSLDSLTILEAAESLQKVRIDFRPSLRSQDGLVTVSFVRESLQSQLLTMEDIRRAISAGSYSSEMHFCSQGRTVFQPTKQLTIECSFPPWYRPWSPRPRVTYRSVEVPEIQNELHIEDRTDVPVGLRLRVPETHLHVGYVYAIVWQPPTRSELSFREAK